MNTHPNERALIDACLRGEAHALHELFVRFRQAVHAGAAKAIRRRLGICGTADDLADQFFVQLIESPTKVLHTSADRLNLATWLTAVAYRQCSKMLRSPKWRRWPLPRSVGRSRNLDTLPAPMHHKLHLADVIAQALNQLDAKSRAMIEARFGLGSYAQSLSAEEIANRDACGRATVYRRLRVALSRLQRIVRAIDDNLEE